MKNCDGLHWVHLEAWILLVGNPTIDLNRLHCHATIDPFQAVASLFQLNKTNFAMERAVLTTSHLCT